MMRKSKVQTAETTNIATLPPKTMNVASTGENPENLKEHIEAAGPPNFLGEIVVEDQKEPDQKKVRLPTPVNIEEG